MCGRSHEPQDGPTGVSVADSRSRLERRLRRELDCPVERTEEGGWITTSNLPHEIRLHVQAGVELVRVSAGMTTGVKVTKALLTLVNDLNVQRAFCRRIVLDDKVLVVAETPLALFAPVTSIN